MQNFKENKYFKVSLSAFFVIAAAIILFMLAQNTASVMSALTKFMDILSPFIWGFAFAYLLNYPYKWFLRLFEKAPKFTGRLSLTGRRIISLILTYSFFLALVTLFFYIIAPQIVTALSDFIKILPEYLDTLSIEFQAYLYKYLERFGLSMDDIYNILTKTGEQISNNFSLSAMLNNALDFVLSLSVKLKNLLLGLIVSVYFLLDKDKFRLSFKKLLYAVVPEQKGDKILTILKFTDRTFGGFIVSKVVDSAIIGVLNYLFMAVMNMEYAVLISVLVGVTNVIPFFGPFIGGIPSVLLLLLVNPWDALIFGIFIIILQQFDGNFLGPKLMGDSMGIRAVFVVFAVIVFGGLFGFFGMFVGVPVFVVLYTLFCEWVADRLKQKNIKIQ